jgi:hemerythrin
MILLSWRENYRVGIQAIDTEHQYLFKLINEFHDKYAYGDTHRQLVLVLNRLVAYAEEHFRHEEALMQQIGYPRVARQREMHAKLYTSIFALNEKLSLDGAKADAETLRFLKTWIIGHILNEDMDIGEFLRRKCGQSENKNQETIKNPNADLVVAQAGTAEPAQVQIT